MLNKTAKNIFGQFLPQRISYTWYRIFFNQKPQFSSCLIRLFRCTGATVKLLVQYRKPYTEIEIIFCDHMRHTFVINHSDSSLSSSFHGTVCIQQHLPVSGFNFNLDDVFVFCCHQLFLLKKLSCLNLITYIIHTRSTEMLLLRYQKNKSKKISVSIKRKTTTDIFNQKERK